MKQFAVVAIVLGALAIGSATPASAAPSCRAIPFVGCAGTPDNPMQPDRTGPKTHKSGKKNVNDGKKPAISFR